MSQIMQKKMVSTEFSAMFKQLSLLRTSIKYWWLNIALLFECQSPSAEVTEQCVEYSQYLQQNINEWSKPAYLNDAAFKTCLKSNIRLNYTTLTVHKL